MAFGHTPVGSATTVLDAARESEDDRSGLNTAPDLRVAVVAAPDSPDKAISRDNLDPLVSPGGLKFGGLDGDDGLSVGVMVLELPLQAPVMINTNNNTSWVKEKNYVLSVFECAREARLWQTHCRR